MNVFSKLHISRQIVAEMFQSGAKLSTVQQTDVAIPQDMLALKNKLSLVSASHM